MATAVQTPAVRRPLLKIGAHIPQALPAGQPKQQPKPIMLPDLNKRTMTIKSADGTEEVGALKPGSTGFAVCELASGVISTEIPNLALADVPRKSVRKKPAAKAKNSKKGGHVYYSEDESEQGSSGDDVDALAAPATPGGAHDVVALAAPAMVEALAAPASSGSAHDVIALAAPAALPAPIADEREDGNADDANADEVRKDDLAHGLLYYKNSHAIGIRAKRKGPGEASPKQLFSFGDKMKRITREALDEIGNACCRKLHNGANASDVKSWAQEQVRLRVADSDYTEVN